MIATIAEELLPYDRNDRYTLLFQRSYGNKMEIVEKNDKRACTAASFKWQFSKRDLAAA